MKEYTIELKDFVNYDIITEYIDTYHLDEINVKVIINFFYKKVHFIVIKEDDCIKALARSNIRFYVLDCCRVIDGIKMKFSDYSKTDKMSERVNAYFPDTFRNVWLDYRRRLLREKVFPNDFIFG